MKGTILYYQILLASSTFIIPLLALPLSSVLVSPVASSVSTSQLLVIAPTSSDCTSAPFPNECVTAAQAAGPISNSFSRYSVTSKAEQAAIVSWMAFESGDFKYNQNHFPAPGRPGQGTRNMQMIQFNSAYATSLGLSAGSSDPNSILAQVQPIEYSFGSGAWFLTTYCPPAQRAELQTGSQEGWEGFVTTCIGTTVTNDRVQYWARAMQALGA